MCERVFDGCASSHSLRAMSEPRLRCYTQPSRYAHQRALEAGKCPRARSEHPAFSGSLLTRCDEDPFSNMFSCRAKEGGKGRREGGKEGRREGRQRGTLTGKESSVLGFSPFLEKRAVFSNPPSVFCKSVSTQKIPGTHFINCRHVFFSRAVLRTIVNLR